MLQSTYEPLSHMVGPIDITVHVLLFISLFFEVFALITFFELGQKMSGGASRPKRFPLVSIIVPCYNEERTLDRTVASLLALDYPKDKLEILIVDDGSRDGTWAAMQKYEGHEHIRIYHKENGGKHTALNFGIERAHGEMIGCLDADSVVDAQALNEITALFEQEEKYKAIIPSIKISDPKNVIQLVQKAEYMVGIFVRKVFTPLDGNFVTPGPFSIFRREVFEKLGHYREAHNTEDCEMALRMQSNFMKIGHAHRAYIYTNSPATLRALFRQRVRWVYGFIKNLGDYRFMLFNKKYGNLGTFVLPIAALSIFTALFFTTLFLWSLLRLAVDEYIKIEYMGLSRPHFGIDWFFYNTSSVMFLTIAIIALVTAIIAIGKKLGAEKKIFTIDVPLYILLYGFLAPVWLAKSVYDAALSRKGSWTAERN